MHSTIARAQNVFGFFTTAAFIIAVLIAGSDLLMTRAPNAEISVKDVQVVRGSPVYSSKKGEYAHIRFSLSADFSTLFTWNTKQIFVYVSAAWPNSTSLELTNEAVIWDTIITSPRADHLQNIGPVAMKKLVKSAKGKSIDRSRGKIELKNQRPEYPFTSPAGHLAETDNVVLNVHYNVQPWVGVLTWTSPFGFWRWQMMDGGVSRAFKLPALKAKKKPEAAKN